MDADLNPPPAWARHLGLAGLLPFVLGTALVWTVHDEAHPYAVDALATYAALIVSFLGGIHWGLGMRSADPALARPAFAWGVLPSLLAWVAALMPAYAGLVVLGVLLVLAYAVDRRAYPRHGLGAWLTLRFRLSAVAALSCFLAAAGT